MPEKRAKKASFWGVKNGPKNGPKMAKNRQFLHFFRKIQNRAPPQISGIGKGFPNPRNQKNDPPGAAKGFYKRAGGGGPPRQLSTATAGSP